MRCPSCDAAENRVVDTRPSKGGRAVRRRRECSVCGSRFTTYEAIEERRVQVLKRDGSAEDFQRDKLSRSIRIACAKRPVPPSEIDRIVNAVEDVVSREAGLEVTSDRLGEMVMDALRPIDRVAYVRFASVYRNFQDVGEFQEFVDELTLRQRRELQAANQVELQLPSSPAGDGSGADAAEGEA